MRMLFQDEGLSRIFEFLGETADKLGASLHFLSAREIVNVICALEDDCSSDTACMREWRYRLTEKAQTKAAN
jgi:hypothetical protein